MLAAAINCFLAASSASIKLLPVEAAQLEPGSPSSLSLCVAICLNQSKAGTVLAGRTTKLCLATICLKHLVLASERGAQTPLVGKLLCMVPARPAVPVFGMGSKARYGAMGSIYWQPPWNRNHELA